MQWTKWILVAVVLSSCARHQGIEDRPEKWAQKIEANGVENLHRVSPALYRSEQPSLLGMQSLERLGIKTVLSLRAFHSDRRILAATNLGYERITFQTWAPSDDELIRFLKIATDSNKTPILVHCLHGSDRTGAMCAAYRIVVQGWSKRAAFDEMKRGGYGHHKIWSNLERWIEGLDVDAIKTASGSAVIQRSMTRISRS